MNPNRSEFFVKTELSYYINTHKTERFKRPDLFKINGISYEEKLGNICILLDDQSEKYIASVADLPTNKDVLKVLTNNSSEPAVEDQDKIKIKELCVVCWDDGNGDYIWYLGYLKEQNGRFYTIDHLRREIDNTDKLLKYL